MKMSDPIFPVQMDLAKREFFYSWNGIKKFSIFESSIWKVDRYVNTSLRAKISQ